jgi:pimeloyl-ACP methyl ester carboxylesterase
LSAIAPDAHPVDYARHSSVQAALLDIAAQAAACDAIIGWSLGGQLTVRAIAAGMLKPRALVLIATPYQFVATAENPLGMKRDLYEKFRDNYQRNPERTLNKAWELILKEDANEAYVRTYLERQDKSEVLKKDWLRWLDLLDGFSFDEAHLVDFPPTLLLHGNNDVVVEPVQSQRFLKTIPRSKLIGFKDCGHAPHWHDSTSVMQAIQEFIHV